MTHDDMVANILTYYRSASDQQLADGRHWYPLAGRIVAAIAAETHSDRAKVAYALAALSPRNPWRWNVADCYSYAAARAEGRTMPKATTFKRNQLAAWQALADDGQPWVTSAPKVTAFVKAVNGVEDAVVVDVWAVRIATGGRRSEVRSDKDYADIAAAYVEAARQAHEKPRDIQAITWIVAQTEGLASHRVGRHDRTFKAGTSAFILLLMSGQQALGL